MSKIKTIKDQPDGLLYEKVVNYLRDQIFNGYLVAGQSVSSESELCEKFAMSRGPVRQAMDMLVKERLIVRKPGRGTFVRELKNDHGQEKTGVVNIGVFIDDSSGEQWSGFMSEIIQGLSAAAKDSWPECRLSFQFHEDPHEVGSELLNREEFDGTIFVPTGVECMDFLASPSLARRNPVVSFFRQIETSNISQFYVDHEEGAFQATDYLLRSGHEQIGLIVLAPIQSRFDSRLRFAGYRRALEQQGVNFDPAMVAETGLTMAGIRSALYQMLNAESRPTALLIGGQVLFNPCIKLLDAMKIKIPSDMSVIAFDDCVESEMHEPPISVVKQPFVRGTRLAVERLIAEIKKTALDSSIKVSLKPELIIRESCIVRDTRRGK